MEVEPSVIGAVSGAISVAIDETVFGSLVLDPSVGVVGEARGNLNLLNQSCPGTTLTDPISRQPLALDSSA